MTTWMRHPNLPDNPPIEVPDEVVIGHQRSGWEITDPPLRKPTAGESAALQQERKTDAVDARPDESPTAQDGKE